ncbi:MULTISPECIES: preprotein translocase subunit YajC [Legionella]|uniref:Sec translocon accessory complex subunit YajC n=2 Tax=Legionella TaxID=445 RepID=A0A378KRW3_9GAMM|nr:MULTISPECIES: preprotein translocase subunit YajC [Legionella]KTD43709.1 SecYEG protein translocase auxillary subunit [Legionella quateirensis]MBL7479459.1 preprotein translocase subunit YajC [Legionella bononiensis]MBL7527667.1 preprotein translocase subunit YajC [Legionella bononiensis]STY17302.1 SecYEG protein translocase auxillary subunit [Legionella quateirensis]
MSFFISDALAAATTTAPAAQNDGTFSLIMIAAIFVLFYFMLIRPQNKKAKEHRELISRLKKGDEIITTGGMLAKVVSLDEQYIKISPAEGIEISMQKGAVSTVLPKGTLKSL